MGLHSHGGTMPGGLTPICESCGVSLCWDIEEGEALENEEFWNQWKCQDCNGGERMSLVKWKLQQKSEDELLLLYNTVHNAVFNGRSPFTLLPFTHEQPVSKIIDIYNHSISMRRFEQIEKYF
jgi:hypothetical protein